VNLFVDTSVWSLALRRDSTDHGAEVSALVQSLERGDLLVTTGLVLQELLQGFSGPKARELILERFSALPLLVPDRDDHVAAADLRNRCRRRGLQLGTIDALIAQLCVRHSLMLLTADRDFAGAARVVPLTLWRSSARA
jgi:predicted nucleic acid-binding protein